MKPTAVITLTLLTTTAFAGGVDYEQEWVLSARYEMPLTESADRHTFTTGCACVFP